MLRAKNYQIQSMFYKVIQKIKVARFLLKQCICIYIYFWSAQSWGL